MKFRLYAFVLALGLTGCTAHQGRPSASAQWQTVVQPFIEKLHTGMIRKEAGDNALLHGGLPFSSASIRFEHQLDYNFRDGYVRLQFDQAGKLLSWNKYSYETR